MKLIICQSDWSFSIILECLVLNQNLPESQRLFNSLCIGITFMKIFSLLSSLRLKIILSTLLIIYFSIRGIKTRREGKDVIHLDTKSTYKTSGKINVTNLCKHIVFMFHNIPLTKIFRSKNKFEQNVDFIKFNLI